jgi:SAM-dependent methyltransferase
MPDQSQLWSKAAATYEQDFIDPYLPGVRNPLPRAVEELADPQRGTVADFGCGVGPLLPLLAEHFRRVIAVDFAEGMLKRAREACADLPNVEFLHRAFTDLAPLAGQADVAVAVNSLVLPDIGELEKALESIHAALRPGGRFLGVVPGIDAVHYCTMLLVDRARKAGMPLDKAQQNAAHHGEHALYDFAFGGFRFQGIAQHFWQPFEVRYRLRRAGFRRVRLTKVHLTWSQFAGAPDLKAEPPPWDWFFQAEKQEIHHKDTKNTKETQREAKQRSNE